MLMSLPERLHVVCTKEDKYMCKVLAFLADGLEEVECLAVVDVLRRADIDVTLVSMSGNKQVTGSHGITIVADA